MNTTPPRGRRRTDDLRTRVRAQRRVRRWVAQDAMVGGVPHAAQRLASGAPAHAGHRAGAVAPGTLRQQITAAEEARPVQAVLRHAVRQPLPHEPHGV